ncbi:MAG: response regulator [Bacteroidetes bacterium]|nr:MAG: response regulator [Bacteroidota bacterium]
MSQHRTAAPSTILVVDDEDGLRNLIASELTHSGYTVESAEDGSVAISLLRRKQFAVAILDIKMPNVDGIEVLKFIHANCPATKAIMLTGYADLSNAMECQRYGAKDFIDKPFNFQDLLSTVERVMQG